MLGGDRKRAASDYRNPLEPSWCSGCSYYAILSALTRGLAELDIDPRSVTVVSGIGCSSRLPLWLSTRGLHTVHGRALPIAVGAKLARPEEAVIVTAGDGDLFSIGVGHFIHAARSNLDLTVICLDNRMYAMTKNQASPTSSRGYRGTLSPLGTTVPALNVIELALCAGATFVARVFAGDTASVRKCLIAALNHRGFSFVDILSPCRTFDIGSSVRQQRMHVQNINAVYDHDRNDRAAAMAMAERVHAQDHGWDGPINVGIFYQHEEPLTELPAQTEILAASTLLKSAFEEADPDTATM